MEIIFSIDDLDTLKNVCQANKHALSICRRYRVTLCKKFLKRYQVDYNDPDNFIYVQNNVKKEDYFSENGDPNYCELFRLYSKFYDNKEIIFKSRYDGKISSMPLFPNLETLDCSSHNLTSLPNGMVNLKNLSCSSNKLKSLPNDVVLQAAAFKMHFGQPFSKIQTRAFKMHFGQPFSKIQTRAFKMHFGHLLKRDGF